MLPCQTESNSWALHTLGPFTDTLYLVSAKVSSKFYDFLVTRWLRKTFFKGSSSLVGAACRQLHLNLYVDGRRNLLGQAWFVRGHHPCVTPSGLVMVTWWAHVAEEVHTTDMTSFPMALCWTDKRWRWWEADFWWRFLAVGARGPVRAPNCTTLCVFFMAVWLHSPFHESNGF